MGISCNGIFPGYPWLDIQWYPLIWITCFTEKCRNSSPKHGLKLRFQTPVFWKMRKKSEDPPKLSHRRCPKHGLRCLVFYICYPFVGLICVFATFKSPSWKNMLQQTIPPFWPDASNSRNQHQRPTSSTIGNPSSHPGTFVYILLLSGTAWRSIHKWHWKTWKHWKMPVFNIVAPSGEQITCTAIWWTIEPCSKIVSCSFSENSKLT